MRKIIINLIIALVILNLSFVISYAQSWQTLMDSTKFYEDKKDFNTALQWAEKAEQLAKTKFNMNDSDLIDLYYDSYKCNHQLGNIDKSIQYCEKIIQIMKELKKEDSPDYSVFIGELALSYKEKGDYNIADTLFQEALMKKRKVFSENSDEYINTLSRYEDLLIDLGFLAKSDSIMLICLEYTKKKEGEISLKYSIALNNYANLKSNQGNYQEAEKLYKQSLEIKRQLKLEETDDYAITLNNSASVYWNNCDYQKAEDMYYQSLAITQKIHGENHPETATTLNNIGTLLTDMGRYDEAIEILKKSISIKEKSIGTEHPEYAKSLHNLALVYYQKSENNIADSIFVVSLEILKKSLGENNPKFAKYLSNTGALYCEISQFSKAFLYFNKALEILKKNYGENHPDLAGVYGELANYYKALDSIQKSEEFYKKALEIYKTNFGEKYDLYNVTLHNLAMLYKSSGKYEQAEALFLQSLNNDLNLYGENNPKLANSYSALATLYNNMGSYIKADSLYKLALDLDKKYLGEENDTYATILNNIALFYHNIGKYSESEKFNNQAIEIRKRISGDNSPQYFTLLHNKAALYVDLCRYEEAEKLYDLTIEFKKFFYGENHSEYALDIGSLGSLYIDLKRYEEAEKYIIKAREIFKKNFGEMNSNYISNSGNLAIIYNDIGKFDEAEKISFDNIKIINNNYGKTSIKLAFDYNTLGKIYKNQHKLDKSEEYYKKALEIANLYYKDSHLNYTILLNNIASMYLDKNELDSAEVYSIKAKNSLMKIIDATFVNMSEEQKYLFWIDKREWYDKFCNFAIKRAVTNPKILEVLFDFTIATKGIILKSSINEKGPFKKYNSLSKTLKSSQELLSKVAINPSLAIKMNIRTDSLKGSISEIEKEISLNIAEAKNNQPISEITWRDVKNSLRYDEAAVEIIRYNKYGMTGLIGNSEILAPGLTNTYEYFALIINGNQNNKQNSIEYVDIGSAKDIEVEAFNDYSNSIKIKSYDKKSYNVFWKKIRNKIPNAKKVYVSPDGVYNKINLNTLYNPETGKYVLDECEIRMLTNTKNLTESKSTLYKISNTAFLIGNPEFNSKYIKPLPGTKIEIQNISELLKNKGWTVSTLLDSDASEKNLKMVINPKILHIATHGIFQSIDNKSNSKDIRNNPLIRSYLIFSDINNKSNDSINNNTDDGYLTAYEAMNLNLDNTELVVLSACETGLGDINNGEGVYGLQRAFIVAGAKTLIMSLWKVDDTATQELMTTFYKEWLGGKTKREAFKLAQLQLKDKYTYPYYWGAFVMVGE